MSQNNQPSWTGNTIFADSPGGSSLPVLVGKRLGAGGEGIVFQDASRPDYVLKIMHTPTLQSESKVRGMLACPPAAQVGRYQSKEYVQIAWPQELLVGSTGAYIGFSMRYLNMSLTVGLGAWTNLRERRINNLSENDRIRVHLAANLASVTNYVNQAGHALIDLKPANVVAFRQNGHVCLVDCDGFRIQANGLIFPASAYTPNYLAPEYHTGTGGPAQCGEEQDRFALAAVIYELLDNGIHPFSGIDPGQAGNSNGIAPMIKQRRTFLDPHSGLSAHKRSHYLFFPDDTLQLFLRAFTGPSNQRPTSGEWKAHLVDVAQNRMEPCSVNQNHWGFGKGCPWCMASQVQIPPPHSVRAYSTPQPSSPTPSAIPYTPSVSSQLGISQTWTSSSYSAPLSTGQVHSTIVPSKTAWSQGQNSPWFKRHWKPTAAIVTFSLCASITYAYAWVIPNRHLETLRTQYASLTKNAAVLHRQVNSALVSARIRPNLQSLESGIQGSLSSAQHAIAARDFKDADQALSLAGTTLSSLQGFLENLPPDRPVIKDSTSGHRREVQPIVSQTQARLSPNNPLLNAPLRSASVPNNVQITQEQSQQQVTASSKDNPANNDAPKPQEILHPQNAQGGLGITGDTPRSLTSAISDQIRSRYRELRNRAELVSRALQPLESAQAAAGYGLRNDMAGAEVRMNSGLRDTTEAINNGRDNEAQQSMDTAEKAIEQLEKFLSIR